MKFTSLITEKARLLISIGLAFFLLLFLYLQSNGMVEGGQDSYNHFLISKYAFKYPALLLDQWGKPVYTLLAHPFASLGLPFAVWFNIVCTLCAAVLGSLCVKKLQFSNYWITFWIIIFTPISLGNTISSLTEPLNMLLLSGGFYLWVNDRKVAATLLFSFMPWIRTEGFVIIVPFLVFLIVRKHYKLIPYLISATVLFNFLGWWQTGKPLWFITDNPYFLVETETERFAPGPGSFLYYFKANKFVFGNLVFYGSLLFGIIISYGYIVKKETRLAFVFWVVMGIFVAYFFAHSYIMWKGMMGTHGMLRVMMVIVPCLAIVFNIGYALLISYMRPTLRYLFIIGMGLLLTIHTFSSYKACGYPTVFFNLEKKSVKPIANVENLKKAQQFIENQGLNNRVIYHQVPIYNVLFDKDPFAKPLTENWVTEDIWSIDLKNNWAPKGSILLWDSYHAQREGNLPFDTLQSLKSYQLLYKVVESENEMGVNDFYIYEKIE